MNTPDKDYFKSHPYQLTQYFLKSNYPEFLEYIITNYPDIRLSEAVYRYYHGGPTKCPMCGNDNTYISFSKGYTKHCSPKCSKNSKTTKDKYKQTCLERYGVESANSVESVKEKVKKTNIERYGVERPLQNKEFLEKVKKTNIERYGVEYRSQSAEAKAKTKKTNMERYGVEHVSQVKSVREKAKQTCRSNFGTDYPMQSAEVKAKSKKTCRERYNTDNVAQNEIIKDKFINTITERYGGMGLAAEVIKNKTKKTNLERYGVENPMQNDDIKNKSNNSFKNTIINNKEHLIGYTVNGEWICKCPHPECNKCTERFYIIPHNKYYDRARSNSELCTRLLPIDSTNQGTTPEIFIRNILDKHNIEYQCNVRNIISPKELDIYIPSKNIAIECNGIYWHSEKWKDNNYHINKFKECLNKDIQLITIWEDWIINKPDIIESILLSKLGIYQERIYARKCVVKEIKSKDCNIFLNNNHIQGKSSSKLRLGLYYNDILVSVMTFSSPRANMGNKECQWELVRFCNKLHTQVIGGASKLFNYFIGHYDPESIFSFSSNDISIGSLYNTLGFTATERYNASYWYIDKLTGQRYHRSTFTKQSIVRRGWKDTNDRSWTESQVMEEHGYLKIYDSGQMKWIFNKSI